MKIAIAYLLFVIAVLGGAFAIFQSAIVKPAAAVAASSEHRSRPVAPKFANRQAKDEPSVDPNDPKLFDARGEFPQAMRDAMAAAKRDSMKAGTAVKIAAPKPIKRVRRQPRTLPPEMAQGAMSFGPGQRVVVDRSAGFGESAWW